jgi:hypothetical protein
MARSFRHGVRAFSLENPAIPTTSLLEGSKDPTDENQYDPLRLELDRQFKLDSHG